MRFFKILNHYKISLFILTLTFFLLGYFLTENVYNNFNSRYIYIFSSDSDDVNIVLNASFYEEAIQNIEQVNAQSEKKISYAKIDYSDMVKSASLAKKENYEFSVLRKFFPNLPSTKTGQVKDGQTRAIQYFNLILTYSSLDSNYVDMQLVNYQNPFIIGGISAAILLTILLMTIGVIVLVKKEEWVVVEDNQTIFKSIFHKKYWQEATTFCNQVKKITTIGMLFGMMLLCKFIPIPSGFGSLGLSFTYLFFSLIALIYGPLCGIFIGACSDIIGYFIAPSGVFFLGYTLDAMLAGFIYGVFFYKKRITFSNCLMARLLVNLGINVGLGGLWWKILYGLDWNGYLAYLTLTAIPKNVIYLLPQSILLFVIIKALSKPLVYLGLLDEKIGDNVSLF